MARGAKPDLVVLDTVLPDRSGLDLCRDLREGSPADDRPVLIATTQTATSGEVAAMSASADDFLIKPYVVEALILRMNQHLQKRH